jgi:hypothetical protein
MIKIVRKFTMTTNRWEAKKAEGASAILFDLSESKGLTFKGLAFGLLPPFPPGSGAVSWVGFLAKMTIPDLNDNFTFAFFHLRRHSQTDPAKLPVPLIVRGKIAERVAGSQAIYRLA